MPIDIEKTLYVLRVSHRPDLELKRALMEVWADAYAQGWSDGQRDDDPNILDNPYADKKGLK